MFRRQTMSHKKSLKRSRGLSAEIPALASPPMENVPSKRSKLQQHTDFEESSSVRRSSRAPKPKVFDDEYAEIARSNSDENETRGKKEKAFVGQERRSSSDSLGNVFDADASIRRSSRVPKPKLYNEDYIDSPKGKTDLKANERESIKTLTGEVSSIGVETSGLKPQKQNPKLGKQEKRKSKNHPEQTFIGENTPRDEKVKKTSSTCKQNVKLNFSIASLLHDNPTSTSEDTSRGIPDLPGESLTKKRQSTRTPVPKKAFTLIEDVSYLNKQEDCLTPDEDSEIDIESISSPKPSHRSKKKHQLTSSSLQFNLSSSAASSSTMDVATLAAMEHGKKKGKSKQSEEQKPKKKPKKGKHDSEIDCAGSTLLPECVTRVPVPEESRKNTKDKSKKNSPKMSTVTMVSEKPPDNKEVKLHVVEEEAQVKNKSKKRVSQKAEVGGSGYPSNIQSSPALLKEHSKHSSSEHGKKSHSKHSRTKHDKPHSETRDQDQHIILKLHLPHADGSSHHTHSHKKHKHKHHSAESKAEGSSAESKSKKRKLSLESAPPNSNEEAHKKKVSVKFKGLSSDNLVEVEVASSHSGADKAIKEPDTKPKKSKKKLDVGTTPALIASEDQEHLKMVIKKKKKEMKVIESGNESTAAGKTQNKVPKSKPKEPKTTNKEEGDTRQPKGSSKKSTKASDTPSKSPKEKRKVVTGYLLFCKKERSIVAEANPGLEFVEISKKVGDMWNNLSEKEKQKWKEKADNLKAKLGISKKEDKKPDAGKSGPEVLDVAAHLKLLGQSLSLIGVSLMAQRETEVHGSLSVLLDSILCAICPLTFLTSHIPGIPGITKDNQVKILDDLAYTMPGLG